MRRARSARLRRAHNRGRRARWWCQASVLLNEVWSPCGRTGDAAQPHLEELPPGGSVGGELTGLEPLAIALADHVPRASPGHVELPCEDAVGQPAYGIDRSAVPKCAEHVLPLFRVVRQHAESMMHYPPRTIG